MPIGIHLHGPLDVMNVVREHPDGLADLGYRMWPEVDAPTRTPPLGRKLPYSELYMIFRPLPLVIRAGLLIESPQYLEENR